MEQLTKALRELSESNKQLAKTLSEVERAIVNDRDERTMREERRAKNSLEMDIKFIMDFKSWSRGKALEKLEANDYDVATTIKGSMGMVCSHNYLERILCHYEHKKNREIIEKW